jgi:alkanesulfonate monooxygenase SsuD/methylene tetrahydromethanopterin reductase-like flavin-dependent oxidoreductase (luciferase family)
LRGERPSLDGARYTAREAMNEPPVVGRIPVMIGGGGERKTLRMVAQYADESNIICAPDDVQRKLDALDGHCAALGRDRSEITVSWQRTACIAPTAEEAKADLVAYFGRRGLDLASMTDEEQGVWLANFIWGDPDTVGEQFAGMLQPGIDGFTINMPANGHIEGRVALLGQTLAPLIA